jgi:hypothetical protein
MFLYTHKIEENLMAQKLDKNEMVTFEEMLLANSAQVDAAVQLLIEKGFFSKEEFFDKLKQVYAEYKNESAEE